MPHIAVMMYPGRDEETKKALAQKIQDLVVEELKLPREVVSVSMNDIEKEKFPEAMAKIPMENRIELK
ncbi:MAG: tautomerase family protein [Clostridia bacterium]|nr:tautomerase family protein [Clostridia bacterium]